MKIRRFAIVISSVAMLFGLVAWTASDGFIVVGSGTGFASTGSYAIVGTGSTGKARNALIVGTSHEVSKQPASPAGAERSGSIIAGNMNKADASTTLISGSNNEAFSFGGNNLETRASGIIGANNKISHDHGYILGYYNHVSGDYGAAIGYNLNNNQPQAVVLGKYNAEMVAGDTFAIGSGTNASPFTALKVTTGGNVILGKAQGDITMGDYQ